MEKVLEKFVEIIDRLYDEYKEKASEFDNASLNQMTEQIRKYQLARGAGKINIDALRTFIDALELGEKHDIAYYEETLGIIEKFDGMPGFEKMVDKYKAEFKKLDEDINIANSKLFKKFAKNGSKLNEYNATIKTIEEIKKFIKSNELVLDEEKFNSLLELLNNINELGSEEKISIVSIITKKNADNMQTNINNELTKQQQKEEEKKKERKKRTPKKVTITKTKVKEEKKIQDVLTEEELEIYNKAKQISEQEVSLSENIATIFNSVQNKSTDEKIALYDTFPDFNDQLNIIIYDLKENILAKLSKLINNKEALSQEIEGINRILEHYEDIANKKNLIENVSNLDIKAILREFGLEDKIVSIKKSEILLEKCKKMIIEHPENITSEFTETYGSLKDLREEVEDFVRTYNSGSDGSYQNFLADCFDMYEGSVNEMQRIYDEINNSIGGITLSEKEELYQLGKEFYNSTSNTCFYVFLDNGSDTVPIIMKDINEDEKLKPVASADEDILKGMKDFCDNTNPKKYNGLHHSKADNLYSEEFLRKYHVKGLKAGHDYRLFYTRVSSNWKELYGKDMPEILIIYKAGYALDDGRYKKEINYEALKRCYDNQQWVDEIMNLFNTDVSSLSEEDRTKYKEKIEQVMREQYIKMGYFVKKVNEKEQGKVKGKED